jgi:hypothetical protein
MLVFSRFSVIAIFPGLEYERTMSKDLGLLELGEP